MFKKTGGPFVVYSGDIRFDADFGSLPEMRGVKHYWLLPLDDPRNAELKIAMKKAGISDSWAKPPGSS